MNGSKKPFYKKWWVWLIAVIVLIALVTPSDNTDITKENNEPDEVEEKEVDSEQEDSVEEVLSIVEYEEELLFGEYTVKNIKTEIIDDELKLMFNWINQSGKDDIPLTSVGYFDVTQGDEILKETSGAFDPTTSSDVLKKVDNGITAPVTVVYELVNDEPIEVKFGATAEIDDTTGTIVIENK